MRQAGESAAGAHAANDRVEFVPHLLPYLRRGGLFVRLWVGGVTELVHEEGVGCFPREALGHVTVILRMTFADVGACQHDLGAHGLEVEDLLLAHLVRNDEQQAIALLRGDQRQPQPRVTCGGLDKSAARLDLAVALGSLDEIQADAVLDGATRILVLELEKQLAGTGIEVRDGDERRVADHLQHVAKGLR